MHCTVLTEPTWPLLAGLAVCELDFTERDTGPRGWRLHPGSHYGSVMKTHWHSASDGQTRDLDRSLGPGEERGQFLEASQ